MCTSAVRNIKCRCCRIMPSRVCGFCSFTIQNAWRTRLNTQPHPLGEMLTVHKTAWNSVQMIFFLFLWLSISRFHHTLVILPKVLHVTQINMHSHHHHLWPSERLPCFLLLCVRTAVTSKQKGRLWWQQRIISWIAKDETSAQMAWKQTSVCQHHLHASLDERLLNCTVL